MPPGADVPHARVKQGVSHCHDLMALGLAGTAWGGDKMTTVNLHDKVRLRKYFTNLQYVTVNSRE